MCNLAYRGPITSCLLAPLLPFASRLLAGCRIACCHVPPPRITFRCAAAPCIHPRPLFFVRASCCCVASLRTASTSRRAATSQLAVLSPSQMHRCSCRQCAGIFTIIAIAIVTLIARCQAGVIALVVVVVVNVRRHSHPRHIPLRRCHHRQLCRPSCHHHHRRRHHLSRRHHCHCCRHPSCHHHRRQLHRPFHRHHHCPCCRPLHRHHCRQRRCPSRCHNCH